jgi:hypothetical protein
MARYRVLELSYFNERIVEPGEEIAFVGIAGSNLALIGNEHAAQEETMAALRIEAHTLGISVERHYGPLKLAQLIGEARQKLAI